MVEREEETREEEDEGPEEQKEEVVEQEEPHHDDDYDDRWASLDASTAAAVSDWREEETVEEADGEVCGAVVVVLVSDIHG